MRMFKDNGLTLALMALFIASLTGMLLTGWQVENRELTLHSQATVTVLQYFFSSSFQSSLFENWESEFLQMSAYVMMTAILFQRGSSESKDPDDQNAPENDDPESRKYTADTPWPVRAGGWWSRLYSCSLGIVLGNLVLA